jgi:hypothetical protein
MRIRVAALLALASALLLAAPADAWRTSGLRWQTRTIGYFSLAPEYDWSLQWAAYVWNASGANIRFVPVPRARAQVLIVRKQFPADAAEDGIAITRFRKDGTIVGASVGIRERLDVYEAALVATHEFGHVLGLEHEDRGCAVMNSRLLRDHPFKCPAPAPGRWWCRLLTADDVAGAVRIYGGTPKRPSRPDCARRTS